jgi:prepilin-type N-terminal cleavage/methylation domain-containing protein/prepilin-type processing-associated H-X9-DG protein
MLRRPAFTLVELLVVIGLIAILIGLLIPAVSMARQNSGQVICAANLRQWALAVNLYAQQYDDYLPRRGQGVQPVFNITRPTDWFNALPPMMKMTAYQDLVAAGQTPHAGDGGLWICPQTPDISQGYLFSYAMNMWLSTWQGPQPDRIDKVGSMATMVFMADGPGQNCSCLPSSAAYSPVARHHGRVNTSFLDGHVVAFDAAYVGCGIGFVQHPDVRWQPPNSPWPGPASSN